MLVLSIGIVTWMMAAFNYVIAIFCMPGTATLGSGTQDTDSYIQLDTWLVAPTAAWTTLCAT